MLRLPTILFCAFLINSAVFSPALAHGDDSGHGHEEETIIPETPAIDTPIEETDSERIIEEDEPHKENARERRKRKSEEAKERRNSTRERRKTRKKEARERRQNRYDRF